MPLPCAKCGENVKYSREGQKTVQPRIAQESCVGAAKTAFAIAWNDLASSRASASARVQRAGMLRKEGSLPGPIVARLIGRQ